jgi:hypothetical protein
MGKNTEIKLVGQPILKQVLNLVDRAKHIIANLNLVFCCWYSNTLKASLN